MPFMRRHDYPQLGDPTLARCLPSRDDCPAPLRLDNLPHLGREPPFPSFSAERLELLMGFEDILPDDAATWALESAADSAAQHRTLKTQARLPGLRWHRRLEAVPEFAFLAMPEQNLD